VREASSEGGSNGHPCCCSDSGGGGSANRLHDPWKLLAPRVTTMWSKVGVVWSRSVSRGQIQPEHAVISRPGFWTGCHHRSWAQLREIVCTVSGSIQFEGGSVQEQCRLSLGYIYIYIYIYIYTSMQYNHPILMAYTFLHSQYIDIFTKGLPSSIFTEFRSSLNVS
jgi:hypothetical protein